MVVFAVPIVASIFTALIGGTTLHFARRNNQQRAQTETNDPNTTSDNLQNEKRKRKKS